MLRAAGARGLRPAQPASLPSPPPPAPLPSLPASTIAGSASSSSAATSSSSSNGGGGSMSNCVRGNPPHTTVHDGPRSALRPAPSLVHFLRTPFLSSPLTHGLLSPSVTAVAAAAAAARAHHRLLSRSSQGRSATITAFRDDDWDPTKEGGAFPSSLPVRRSGGSGGGGGYDPSWPYSGLPGSPSGPWSIKAQQKQEQKQPAAGGGGGPGRGRGGDDDGRGGWGGGGGGGDGGSEGGSGWNLPFAATAVMLLLPFLSQFFLAVHICYCFLLLMESGKERLAAASKSSSNCSPTTSSSSTVTEQLPPIAAADPASNSFTSSSGIGVIGSASLKSSGGGGGGGGGRDEVGRRLSLQPAVPIFMMLLSSALRLCGSLQPCPEAYAYGLASAVGLTVWAGGRCLAFRELTPSGLMSAFSASMAAVYSTALYHATP